MFRPGKFREHKEALEGGKEYIDKGEGFKNAPDTEVFYHDILMELTLGATPFKQANTGEQKESRDTAILERT